MSSDVETVSSEEIIIDDEASHEDTYYETLEQAIEVYRKYYPTKKCQNFPFPKKIGIKEFNNSISDIVCEKISNLKYSMEKRYYLKINKYLLRYPDFAVQKIDLDPNLLDELPPKNERSREQVLEWMEKHMDVDDITYVGW